MPKPSFSPELPRPVRGACLLASSIASFGILGGLLLAWHLQAEPVWLAATPAVLAEVATCERVKARLARLQCLHELVLARAPQHRPAAVLAAR